MGKVIISGEGGQGVRVIAHVLATILAHLGYEISLLYDYDSSVRLATSMAYLTWSKEPIDNPVLTEADILLKLSRKGPALSAERTVCESGLCTDEEIPFSQLGIDVFGKEIFGNMIALGRLLRLIGLDVPDEELAQALPIHYRLQNLNAVHYGYGLKEEDLHRGMDSRKSREVERVSLQPGTGDLEADEYWRSWTTWGN
jgi:Pyruvate/2-oxoacid:ferredoxin oxidoreductase gamma subunit